MPPPPVERDPKLRLAQFREGFAHVPQILALVWRASRVGTALLVACTLAGSFVPLAIAYVGKRIVDAVVAHQSDVALRLVALELGLVAAQALVNRGNQLVQSQLGARLVIEIHVLILEKALKLELKHFENHDFYDKLMRARQEASYRPVSLMGQTLGLIQNSLTLLGFIALLIQFSGWAVLGLIVAAVPATITEMYYSSKAFKLQHWRSPERRRLNYLEYVLANDGHVKEVKLLRLGPRLLARYKEMSERFYREDRALALKRGGWGYLLSLIGSAAFYICYGTMAIGAAAGRLSLGNLTLYVASFRQGQQSFQNMLGAIGQMYEDSLYLSNLFAYLAIDTDEHRALAPHAVENEEGIRFDDVGFKYPFPEQSNWVFRNLNLVIPRGQAMAIVGPNGAGKTTMIKLMTGLYAPTEGRVLIDGRDVRDWDKEELHRRFSAVFQDFNRYQFTARENINVGSLDNDTDQPRIERAVEKGGATELIADLPKGLDTQLGTWFKGGKELSGGQWQKLGLARAFMREESDILILDEPTAALDAETEHAVFERFRMLSRGRTTILISHRFPTVRMADRIIVLDEGRILEEGSHAELVAKGARYAHLFTLQAQGYQ